MSFLLIGGFLFFWVVGLVMGRVYLGEPKPYTPPKPLDISRVNCGCGHNIAFHEEEEGCRAWNQDFKRDGKYMRCECQKYMGPEYLPPLIG